MQNLPMNYYGGSVPQLPNYQMYNKYNQNQTCINAVLVSNIKEAEAAQPDPYGNPTIFYNIAKNEIYMKQFNNMSLAPLYVYKFSGEYKPADNQNAIIMDYENRFDELNGKIDNMTALLSKNLNASYPQDKIQRKQ